jgi:GH18 family chitinase
MKKYLFCILLLSLILTNPVQARDKESDFKVVGYYSMRSAMTDFRKFPFKRVTHVNLFFLNPDTLGNYNQDYTTLEPFIKKAHKKGVKVLFSIGGGGAHPYYHRLLQDDKRGMIVQKLVDMVITHNLDGIDNDLEHGDIDENYEPFVLELKSALVAHNKLLTAAVVVSSRPLFSDVALSQYDFVNVMSYDHTGPWNPEKPGHHSTYAHAVEDLSYFGNQRNISAERMTLGVPFYGYGFGPELTSKAKSMNYRQIVETYPGSEVLDELKIEDGKIMYYNGIPTIKKKTELALEKAGGIMIWQLGGDARGSKSLLKVIYETSHKK